MNSRILQKIKDRYEEDCHCFEKGTRCRINLHGLCCIVIKGEKHAQNSEKMCDCFIFDDRNTLTIHLVELKSRVSDAYDIKEKFENGLNACSRILKGIKLNEQYTPKLILAAHNYGRHTETKKLQKIQIKFNGKTHHIYLEKCGLKLVSLSSTK